jgi:hypothetical protein
MSLRIGKLYDVVANDWLCVSSYELAVKLLGLVFGYSDHNGSLGTPSSTDAAPSDAAPSAALYWSGRVGCPIVVINRGSLVVLLEQDRPFVKLLTSEGTVCWTAVALQHEHCFKRHKE